MGLAAVLAIGLGALGGRAQSVPIEVNIPFDFAIVGTWLEAGSYRVDLMHGQVCRFTRADGRTVALKMGIPVHNAKVGESRLTFNQYGDRYFLSRIFWSGYSSGQELPKSSAEAEIAKTMGKDQTVVVRLR